MKDSHACRPGGRGIMGLQRMERFEPENVSHLFKFLLYLQTRTIPGSSDSDSGDTSSEDNSSDFGIIGHGRRWGFYIVTSSFESGEDFGTRDEVSKFPS